VNKEYSKSLASMAAQILADSGVDVNHPISRAVILQLAKIMRQRTGAHVVTCKRHIARAIRRARWGEPDRQWGGPRPGAGRPRKETEECSDPLCPVHHGGPAPYCPEADQNPEPSVLSVANEGA
jgi:hypothetical protein